MNKNAPFFVWLLCLILVVCSLQPSFGATDSELRGISPQQLEELQRARPGAFKAALKSFPLESLYFYAAQGLLLTTTILTELNKNPVAVEQYFNQPKDPVGHISFFAFILANRNVASRLGRLLEQRIYVDSAGKVRVKDPLINPQSRMGATFASLNGFIGMGAGMFASHMVSNILYDQNLKKCAVEILYSQPKDFCELSYSDWVVHGKIRRLIPDLVTLFSAAIIGGVSFETVRGLSSKSLEMISRTSLFQKVSGVLMKGVQVPIQATKYGAGGPMASIGRFFFFLGAEHLLRHELNAPLQRMIYHGHLGFKGSEFGILNRLKKKIYRAADAGKMKQLHELLEEYNFEKRKYFTAQSMELDSLFFSWADKVINLQSLYSAATSFYFKFYRYLYREKDEFNPLDEVNALYGVHWDSSDEKVMKLWNSESEFELLGADQADREFVNGLCLNPEFYSDRSEQRKELCVRQRELMKKHLKQVGLRIDIESVDYPSSFYLPSKDSQRENLRRIKNVFLSGSEKHMVSALNYLNTINRQIDFSKRNNALFSFKEFYWEKLQKEVAGFEDYSFTDSLKRSRTQIVDYLVTPEEKRGILGVRDLSELKPFRPATPLQAGVSFVKWLGQDPEVVSHFEEYQRNFPNDQFNFDVNTIDEYLLASLACGVWWEDEEMLENEDGFKVKVFYPRILEKRPQACWHRKLTLDGYQQMVAAIKESALAWKHVEQMFEQLNGEIDQAVERLEDQFIGEFVQEEFPAMFRGRGMVSWLTGTQSFQQTAIEDVQFYRQLASRMKREQSDIPQWNELEFMDKFRNYVEGVGEQCGSIDEIQLMIGGDIDELITGVESIMDGELDRLALYDRSFSIGPDPVGELNQEFEQIANSFPLSASDRNNYADQIKGLVGEDLTRLQFQAVKSLFHYYKVSVFHEVITGKYGKLQHNKDVAVQINSGLKDTLKLLENYCVQFEKMKDL